MSGGTNGGAATRAARKPELKRPAVKLERLFLMSNEQSIRDEREAEARKYATDRYREVIYLSEYNAAVSAFVEGAMWRSPEPQGEPSDVIAVQNVARIIAAAASDWNHNDCGDDDHHLGHSNWGAYIDDARAALRAAMSTPVDPDNQG